MLLLVQCSILSGVRPDFDPIVFPNRRSSMASDFCPHPMPMANKVVDILRVAFKIQSVDKLRLI